MFEYDANKSRSNKEKHGIDFEEAQALWQDPNIATVKFDSTVEPRFGVIGMIEGKCWTAVITYRGENIRLISVRRSRRNEVRAYEA